MRKGQKHTKESRRKLAKAMAARHARNDPTLPPKLAPGEIGSISISSRGYAQVTVGGTKKQTYLHRHLTNAPKGMEVHHIDGDKLNNDLSNLLVVTPAEHKRIHKEARA